MVELRRAHARGGRRRARRVDRGGRRCRRRGSATSRRTTDRRCPHPHCPVRGCVPGAARSVRLSAGGRPASAVARSAARVVSMPRRLCFARSATPMTGTEATRITRGPQVGPALGDDAAVGGRGEVVAPGRDRHAGVVDVEGEAAPRVGVGHGARRGPAQQRSVPVAPAELRADGRPGRAVEPAARRRLGAPAAHPGHVARPTRTASPGRRAPARRPRRRPSPYQRSWTCARMSWS